MTKLFGDIPASSDHATGCFSAYRNAALSVTNGDTVIFDAEDWDVSSWYDPATGRFTPQVAGYYRLSAAIHPSVALTADKYLQSVVQKNGADYRWLGHEFQRGTTSLLHVAGSALVVANGSTDYFTIVIGHDNGGTVALSVGAAKTHFQGELVGRT